MSGPRAGCSARPKKPPIKLLNVTRLEHEIEGIPCPFSTRPKLRARSYQHDRELQRK
jgi:hypothetical protein